MQQSHLPTSLDRYSVTQYLLVLRITYAQQKQANIPARAIGGKA